MYQCVCETCKITMYTNLVLFSEVTASVQQYLHHSDVATPAGKVERSLLVLEYSHHVKNEQTYEKE